MLIFIDESGDPGLKLDKGSSRFFTIALVVFEDRAEATACDQRIGSLKHELGWSEQSEFHFKRNSNHIREIFLRAVAHYNFFYYGIVINKDPRKLRGEKFNNKESFYKYACGLVFQNAQKKLRQAIVIVDKSGNLDFRNRLAHYLRKKINRTDKTITQVKMQRSGVINRSCVNTKKRADEYRRLVAHHEINVQIWPKF